MARPRRRALVTELAAQRPDLDDPGAVIAAGRVRVDGSYVTNPMAQVTVGASLVVELRPPMRGTEKLGWALDHFAVPVDGRTALDVGAASGGFTTALLERHAARVYAVDVGHGQLTGALRQDARVVNLEATNVADLDGALVPDAVEVVSVDVSYLSLTVAVSQLTERIRLSREADLVGLVKPMFELGAAELPTDAADLEEARVRAVAGVQEAGWRHRGSVRSAVAGRRGAVEFFVHATWPG